MSPRVLVSMVTHNSASYLKRCLESLVSQTYRDFVVHLWDNASTDQSAEIAASHPDLLDFTHLSNENVGFCAAHNRVIASATCDYVLVLNPDVILDPKFIETLVAAMDQDAGVGSATGKLMRWPETIEEESDMPGGPPPDHRSGISRESVVPPLAQRILDTTGIYFTPNQRHLDRGSGESDGGQYEKREYVFGASGAAAFYRRKMLEDVKIGKEYFDEAFFAFREDADLAWRAQWLGWRCLYVPEARGYHVRRVLPERRTELPSAINMHSFKNRFLMRVKNMDAGAYLRFFLAITLRDLGALVYVLVRERSSLPALPLFFRALPRAWHARKLIRSRRRVSPKEMRSWFQNR